MQNLPAHYQQTRTNPRRDRDMAWLERLRGGEYGREVVEWGRGEPMPALRRGIDEFNLGAFFESHETLEQLWREEEYPFRLFYQGLVKAAVALEHFRRGNRTGAIRLAHSAYVLLEAFAPVCLTVDVAALRCDLDRFVAAVLPGGGDGADFEGVALPRIAMSGNG